MRVATYARVSTERQENEETIKSQTMANMDKIANEGHVMVKEYKDEGWSGTILARPGLDQLRVDAKGGSWDALIVYDPDRISRKYTYTQMIVDELEKSGKKVLYVTMPPIKDESDRLLFGVKGLFAEYERVKIADRFRLGKLRKARDGHIITSTAPYGYSYVKRDEQNEGHYEVFPEEARLVKCIFEWVADEGLTIRRVVKRLQDLHIKPRKSHRGVWNTSTLTTMLRNETYIGHAHYLKSEGIEPKNPIKDLKYKRVVKTSRRVRGRSEWIVIAVPAIIEESLFWRVRRQLEINYAVCKRNRKNDYLLASKIYCTCGRKRSGEGRQEGNHLYYRCTDRVYSYPESPNCTEKGINAVVADALVWRGIVDFMSDPVLLKSQVERYLSLNKQKRILLSTTRNQIEVDLENVEKKENRYLSLYGDDRISKDKLNSHIEELKHRRFVLQSELRSVPEKNTWLTPTDKELDVFVEKAREGLKSLNFQTKRGILLKLVDKVVGDQNSLTVTGCLPLGEQFTGYLNNRNVVYGSISRNCWFAKRGEVHSL